MKKKVYKNGFDKKKRKKDDISTYKCSFILNQTAWSFRLYFGMED